MGTPALSQRIAIVSPGFPGRAGGVTDHTQRIVDHWAGAGHLVEVLATQDTTPEAVADRWREARVEAILIQYVPFLYGRLGLSRFPERLARAARRAGLRVTVSVHEPWVPPTRLPWLVTGPLQRRQLHRLLDAADAAVTAVPRWAEMLGRGVRVLYAGSTLGDLPDPLPPIEEYPVVFSPFASGLNWKWIAAAAKAIGASPPLVVIGADASEFRTHRGTREWFDAKWRFAGRLPAVEVLQQVARGRVGLAPFVDGATGRRTSLLVMLSTGIPVVSSTGDLFDPLFAGKDQGLTAARDESGFVDMARAEWREGVDQGLRKCRRARHARHLDPGALDAALLDVVSGAGR